MYRVVVPKFRAIAAFVRRLLTCRHRRVVYPPLWYRDHSYYICFACGKKRLRDTVSGNGIGDWGDDLDELIEAQIAVERRREVLLSVSQPTDSKSADVAGRRSA